MISTSSRLNAALNGHVVILISFFCATDFLTLPRPGFSIVASLHLSASAAEVVEHLSSHVM